MAVTTIYSMLYKLLSYDSGIPITHKLYTFNSMHQLYLS